MEGVFNSSFWDSFPISKGSGFKSSSEYATNPPLWGKLSGAGGGLSPYLLENPNTKEEVVKSGIFKLFYVLMGANLLGACNPFWGMAGQCLWRAGTRLRIVAHVSVKSGSKLKLSPSLNHTLYTCSG